MAILTDYDCYFQVIIRQKSVNGIDLETHRMDDICKDIGKILLEKYPDLGVFTLGFEVVK